MAKRSSKPAKAADAVAPEDKPRRRRHYHEEGAHERRKERLRASEAADVAAMLDGLDGRWWTKPPDTEDVTSGIVGWVERLKPRHRRHALTDALWEAVYRDAPVNSMDSDISAAVLRTRKARQNMAKSMVDTVTARLCKRRPMPCISADDAGFAEKLFARRASRVLRRKMGQSLVERLRPLVARDGVIRGSGVAKVFRDGGDVSIDRVPRREIVVDPVEAEYGSPRTLAHIKRVDKSVLAAMYPGREKEIAAASRSTFDEWRVHFEEYSDSNHVDVYEAWRLPSGPGKKDGRHVICIRGFAPLRDEPWTRPRFPFAFFHWEPPVGGFWAHGLVESLAPIQQEVNHLLGKMSEGISSQMALLMLVPRGSGVEKSHLRDPYHKVLEYDGNAPNMVAPTPFSQPVLQYIQWRIQQCYELSGVSQAMAASKNPLGSSASGKALDTMYDLESDRFSDKELNYAMFAVDLGQCMLDEARDIACADPEDLAEDAKAAWIREIDWKKIEVDGGSYHLVLEPVNFLPESRAGKLAQVKELGEAGLLTDPMETAALFDEPDIARANRHLLGPYRMIERWCEDLSNVAVDLESLTPTPMMVAHVQLATKMCEGELCNVIYEGADDEIQGRFRWALQMLDAEAKAAAAPPPPPPGATDPMAAAAGGAMPPPVDPMMAMGDPAAAAPLDPMAAAGGPLLPPNIDPMGGLTAQLAAGMPAPAGMVM